MDPFECILLHTPNFDKLIIHLENELSKSIPNLKQFKNSQGSVYERKRRFYNWLLSDNNSDFICHRKQFLISYYKTENEEAVLPIRDYLTTGNDEDFEKDIQDAQLVCNITVPNFNDLPDLENAYMQACAASKEGKAEVLSFEIDKFLRAGGDILQVGGSTSQKTLLQLAVHKVSPNKSLTENQLACISIILNKALKLGQKNELLDAIDSNGDTALHLAIKNQATQICIALLKEGASLHIRNNENESSLELIYLKNIPVLEFLLDRDLEVSYDIASDTFKFLPDFRNIIGTLHSAPKNGQNRLSKVGAPSNVGVRYHGGEVNLPLLQPGEELENCCPEMVNLAQFVTMPFEVYVPVLRHPLVKVFLELKWRKMKFFMNMFSWTQIILYLASMFNLMSIALNHFQDVNLKNNTNTTHEDIIFESHKEQILYSFTITCAFFIIMVSIIFIQIFAIRKFATRRYYFSTFNIIVMMAIFLMGLASIPIPPFRSIFALAAVLLSGVVVTGIVGNSNFLHSNYVHVYQVVFKRFFKVMATFSALLLAFAISLSIANTKIPFNRSWAKVFMMLIGELNFDEDFKDANKFISWSTIGLLLYVVIGAMGTIVLIDVFLGYTVHDIQNLERDADVTRRRHQVEQLFRMECLFALTRKATRDKYMVSKLQIEDLAFCNGIPKDLRSQIRESLINTK